LIGLSTPSSSISFSLNSLPSLWRNSKT
jgi:hypothetical protein